MSDTANIPVQDPTKDVLSTETIDIMAYAIADVLLGNVFDTVPPLAIISSIMPDMREENAAALAKKIRELRTEWADRAKILETVLVVRDKKDGE